MIDVSKPLDPVYAGCYGDDGYTHDAQCIVYSGPDTEHQGKEVHHQHHYHPPPNHTPTPTHHHHHYPSTPAHT